MRLAFMWVFERQGRWHCGACLKWPTYHQASDTWPTEAEALEFGRQQAHQAAGKNGFTTYLYRADPKEPVPPGATAEIIRP
jgi:hypothetical protein